MGGVYGRPDIRNSSTQLNPAREQSAVAKAATKVTVTVGSAIYTGTSATAGLLLPQEAEKKANGSVASAPHPSTGGTNGGPFRQPTYDELQAAKKAAADRPAPDPKWLEERAKEESEWASYWANLPSEIKGLGKGHLHPQASKTKCIELATILRSKLGDVRNLNADDSYKTARMQYFNLCTDGLTDPVDPQNGRVLPPQATVGQILWEGWRTYWEVPHRMLGIAVDKIPGPASWIGGGHQNDPKGDPIAREGQDRDAILALVAGGAFGYFFSGPPYQLVYAAGVGVTAGSTNYMLHGITHGTLTTWLIGENTLLAIKWGGTAVASVVVYGLLRSYLPPVQLVRAV